ncbi:MAG: DUF115 domain-containing protein [Treponema sp.]|jgi:hypothetical protein|nr:DUF115 domain-containing protein [Treponema sp.]
MTFARTGKEWENNLALLRQFYPALAGALDDCREDETEFETKVEQSAGGAPTLLINGIYAHSRRDPAREASRAAAAILGASPVPAFFVLGFGLGYTAEAAAALKPDAIPVVVERSRALFRLALRTRDLSAFLSGGKAVLVIGGQSGGVTAALEILQRGGITGGSAVIKNKTLCEASASWYDDAEKRIRVWASRDDINRATLRRFGRRWTGNLGANIHAIRDVPGIRFFEGLLGESGIPVFLAAAGPTLDAAGAHLAEIGERCVTVAADTSLRFFTERGAPCDFVVSVDPQYWNARHLYHTASSGACLVAESAVYPPALRFFKKRLLCRSLFPLGRYVEDRCDPKGALGAGGSVATTAWDFARFLGPSVIWIAGLDLAFPALHTHFKGALFEELAHSASARFVPAETAALTALLAGGPFTAPAADGGAVLTDRRLALYAAWFENAFSASKIPSRAVKSAPAGLAVAGLSALDIGELLALPRRRAEIAALLEKGFGRIDGEFFDAAAVEKRTKNFDEAVGSLRSGLREIARLAEAGAELIRAASFQKSGSAERLRALDRINEKISSSPVKDAAGFLFPPADELEAQLGESDPLARHLEFSALFYNALREAAAFTLGKLG